MSKKSKGNFPLQSKATQIWNPVEGLRKRGLLLYSVTAALSILFLFFGNQYASKGAKLFHIGSDVTAVKARVVQIIDIEADTHTLSGGSTLQSSEVFFDAELLEGTLKGQFVRCAQGISKVDGKLSAPMVGPGDRILLRQVVDSARTDWQFISFVRTDKLLVLAILFMAALLLFGRIKGLNTLVSLAFTCAAVFAVFIPAVLSGKNIYVWAVVTCFYTVAVSFLIISGGTQKTLAAILGCLGGITVSGILTVIMDRVLVLTGYIDEGSYELTYLFGETGINLRAIIFASILIGAMGAIMDIAMSIASSLWELKQKSTASSAGSLFRSGISIGRDIMGTMANTLILAYIGSSLSTVLLLCSYSLSLPYLLNQEMIVVEILQALVGSFGILLTLPLTAAISAALYCKSRNKTIGVTNKKTRSPMR